jgi:hypothetical protein
MPMCKMSHVILTADYMNTAVFCKMFLGVLTIIDSIARGRLSLRTQVRKMGCNQTLDRGKRTKSSRNEGRVGRRPCEAETLAVPFAACCCLPARGGRAGRISILSVSDPSAPSIAPSSSVSVMHTTARTARTARVATAAAGPPVLPSSAAPPHSLRSTARTSNPRALAPTRVQQHALEVLAKAPPAALHKRDFKVDLIHFRSRPSGWQGPDKLPRWHIY